MPDRSNLALREEWQRCHGCHQTRPIWEFLSDDLCLACWLEDRFAADGDTTERVLAAMNERVQIGLSIGNGRNIAYPVSLDYQFTRLLDSLRYWVVKVRLTLAPIGYHDPEDGEVLEGHLRRHAANDHRVTSYSPPSGDLALHRNVDDLAATRVLYYWEGLPINDYARIAKVEIIDPLLLGANDPIVFWEASDQQKAAWAQARRKSFARERVRAKWAVIHLSIIFCVIVGSFIPVIHAWATGQRWQTVGWAVVAFFASIFAGATTAVWEDGPDLRVLRRKDTSS